MAAGWILQEAIAAALAADTVTAAYVVTDNIEAAPPVVIVGLNSPAEQIVHSSGELYEEEIQLDLYTYNDQGSKEARNMAEAIKDVLLATAPDLTASGWAALAPGFKTFENVFAEIDATGREIRHLVLKFKYHTSKA